MVPLWQGLVEQRQPVRRVSKHCLRSSSSRSIQPMKRFPLTLSIILLVCFHVNAQSAVDLGTVHDGTYINAGFGFSYKYPKDWVVHGEATNKHIRELGKEKIVDSGALSESSAEVSIKNTHQLLTVFRYPLGKPGVTFNPGMLIMAENVAYAPGVTNGKDFLLNVRAIMEKAGVQFTIKEPLEHDFAGWQFFRDNSIATMNGIRIVQTHFCKIVNGYALVFFFFGPDQATVDEMAKTMETFEVVLPVRRGVTTIIGSPERPKPN